MSLLVDMEKRLGDFNLRVQFEAEAGALALLGASGCGKSVTLRCIAGILTPDRGKILLDGTALFDSVARINLPPQKRRVGYLFQEYALFPHMTVRQNIAAAVRDRSLRHTAVEGQLRRFRLEDAAELLPRQISGGQRQRAALARMLAAEPRAILLDEPLSALDSFLRQQLETELTEVLEGFSGPAVWVTHDRGEAFRNCRRVCVLDRGVSQPVSSMEALLARPATAAAARLSGCENFFQAVPAENAVFLPEWGAAFRCGSPVPADTGLAGIRARHVRPTKAGAENAFPCVVIRAVEDVSSVTVLLKREGTDAPLLRMELDKALWTAMGGPSHITAAVNPEDILLFPREAENP